MSNIITIMADKLWKAAEEKERSQNDCAPRNNNINTEVNINDKPGNDSAETN